MDPNDQKEELLVRLRKILSETRKGATTTYDHITINVAVKDLKNHIDRVLGILNDLNRENIKLEQKYIDEINQLIGSIFNPKGGKKPSIEENPSGTKDFDLDPGNGTTLRRKFISLNVSAENNGDWNHCGFNALGLGNRQAGIQCVNESIQKLKNITEVNRAKKYLATGDGETQESEEKASKAYNDTHDLEKKKDIIKNYIATEFGKHQTASTDVLQTFADSQGYKLEIYSSTPTFSVYELNGDRSKVISIYNHAGHFQRLVEFPMEEIQNMVNQLKSDPAAEKAARDKAAADKAAADKAAAKAAADKAAAKAAADKAAAKAAADKAAAKAAADKAAAKAAAEARDRAAAEARDKAAADKAAADKAAAKAAADKAAAKAAADKAAAKAAADKAAADKAAAKAAADKAAAKAAAEARDRAAKVYDQSSKIRNISEDLSTLPALISLAEEDDPLLMRHKTLFARIFVELQNLNEVLYIENIPAYFELIKSCYDVLSNQDYDEVFQYEVADNSPGLKQDFLDILLKLNAKVHELESVSSVRSIEKEITNIKTQLHDMANKLLSDAAKSAEEKAAAIAKAAAEAKAAAAKAAAEAKAAAIAKAAAKAAAEAKAAVDVQSSKIHDISVHLRILPFIHLEDDPGLIQLKNLFTDIFVELKNLNNKDLLIENIPAYFELIKSCYDLLSNQAYDEVFKENTSLSLKQDFLDILLNLNDKISSSGNTEITKINKQLNDMIETLCSDPAVAPTTTPALGVKKLNEIVATGKFKR